MHAKSPLRNGPKIKFFFGQTGVNRAKNFCIIQQFETPQDFEAILGS
jgi:hypothetical protein